MNLVNKVLVKQMHHPQKSRSLLLQRELQRLFCLLSRIEDVAFTNSQIEAYLDKFNSQILSQLKEASSERWSLRMKLEFGLCCSCNQNLSVLVG